MTFIYVVFTQNELSCMSFFGNLLSERGKERRRREEGERKERKERERE